MSEREGKLAFSGSEAQKRSSHNHHRLFPLERNNPFKFRSKLFELLFGPVIRCGSLFTSIPYSNHNEQTGKSTE